MRNLDMAFAIYPEISAFLVCEGQMPSMRVRTKLAGIWCQNDVVSTSMRRDHVASTSTRRHFGHVASTLTRRHFGTSCPLGTQSQTKYRQSQNVIVYKHSNSFGIQKAYNPIPLPHAWLQQAQHEPTNGRCDCFLYFILPNLFFSPNISVMA